MAEFTCPKCGGELTRQTGKYGITYRCGGCGGVMAGAAVLRNAAGEENYQQVWREMVLDGKPGNCSCPICGNAMMRSALNIPGQEAMPLDMCIRCQIVWYGARGSVKQAQQPEPVLAGRIMPEAANASQQKAAAPQMKSIDLGAKPEEPYTRPKPEYETNEHSRPGRQTEHLDIRRISRYSTKMVTDEEKEERFFPWVTLSLMVIIISTSVYGFLNVYFMADLAFLTFDPFRYYGANLISASFIHADILHLAGNLYFLYIFGSRVERCGGKLTVLLVFLLGTAGGSLLHLLFFHESVGICLGASGGVSALIGYLLLAMPRERISIFGLVPILSIFYKIRIPVYAWTIIWLALQSWTLVKLWLGLTNVAASAHFGGFITGMLIYLIAKLIKRENREPANEWRIN